MITLFKRVSPHAQRLERWLGAGTVESLSLSMRDWYGPPIGVAGVPGSVWAHKGGDFSGMIKAGQFVHGLDFAEQRLKRIARNVYRRAIDPTLMHAGFSSLSDLISEATTGGKKRSFVYTKTGPTGVVNGTSSLWGLGTTPAAGANASNAPGGDAPTDATQGAYTFVNPTGGDTQHLTSAWTVSDRLLTFLLYDRIFQVNKTMASVTNESVTGVPTRYQGAAGDVDGPNGNFLFVEVGGTALAATAHDWGVAGGNECLYRNQAGTDNTVMPVMTGNSGAIVRRLDHPTNSWFCPLAAGDTGIKDLAQMRCSASVATGVINFVIGHPIAWVPCPLINVLCMVDGINTAFNLTRVFDDAALAWLLVNMAATNAPNVQMGVETVAG